MASESASFKTTDNYAWRKQENSRLAVWFLDFRKNALKADRAWAIKEIANKQKVYRNYNWLIRVWKSPLDRVPHYCLMFMSELVRTLY